MAGFMEERHFITEGVRMKKFFKRISEWEWEEEKRRKAAENPFGEEEDDAFSHDNDFEGFMDEGNGDYKEEDDEVELGGIYT